MATPRDLARLHAAAKSKGLDHDALKKFIADRSGFSGSLKDLPGGVVDSTLRALEAPAPVDPAARLRGFTKPQFGGSRSRRQSDFVTGPVTMKAAQNATIRGLIEQFPGMKILEIKRREEGISS